MIRTFRDVALYGLYEPHVEYDPDYLIKWDPPSTDPVPGYVISANGSIQPRRAFFIPPRIRVKGVPQGREYGLHIPIGPHRSIMVKQVGTNRYIRGMEAKAVYADPLPRTADAVIEFQHVIFENGLPGNMSMTQLQLRFVPDYAFSSSPPKRKMKLEDLPKDLKYAVAVPVDKGEFVLPWLGSLGIHLSSMFGWLGNTNRVTVPRGIDGIDKRLEEEARIRNLYMSREDFDHMSWKTQIIPQSATSFGLESPFAFAIEAFSTLMTVLDARRLFTGLFG